MMVRAGVNWSAVRMFRQHGRSSATWGTKKTTVTTNTEQEVTVPEFGDHRLIFSHQSSSELLRSLFVLQTCAIGPLVKNSHTLLRVGERVLGERVLGAVVAPFYRQFVAGNSEQSLVGVGRRLQRRGVRLMLAPMLESALGEGQGDVLFAANFHKMAWFLELAAAHGGPPQEGAVSPAPALCQAKVTGHCSADVMETVSTQYSAMDPDSSLAAVLWTAEVMATTDEGAADHRKGDTTGAADHRKGDTTDAGDHRKGDTTDAGDHRKGDTTDAVDHRKGDTTGAGDHINSTTLHSTTVQETSEDLMQQFEPNSMSTRYSMALEKNKAFLMSPSCKELERSCPFELKRDDRKRLIDGLRRIAFIGSLAEQLDVVILMDAEFTYLNPAINMITLALMSRHNRIKPLIWNTYQAYLKGTAASLSEDQVLAERLGCCFGLKLVRGAYMDHERQRASSRGQPDPVQDTYRDTNNNYDRLASQEMVAAKASPARHALMLASHNEASVRAALRTLRRLGAGHTLNCVFGQVYGMAENISVPLAASGAVVYKSVPVGSVAEVLPYLARRASENRVVLQGARRERQLLIREIRDRAKSRPV